MNVDWIGFLVTAVIFILTPGVDTIFVLNSSLSGAVRSGVAAAAGIAVGVLCHTLFAAAGLALLLKAYPLLYQSLHYAGALYLIWLGVQKLRDWHKPGGLALEKIAAHSWTKQFRIGLYTNLLNPKMVLFFMSFLPQFVHVEEGGQTFGFLPLGAVYALISLLWLGGLAYLAGSAFTRLLRSERARKIMDGASGIILIALGCKVALSR